VDRLGLLQKLRSLCATGWLLDQLHAFGKSSGARDTPLALLVVMYLWLSFRAILPLQLYVALVDGV